MTTWIKSCHCERCDSPIGNDELKNRPLVFGDKKQIEDLKESNAKAIFCPRCNSSNTGEDCDGDGEEQGDYYFYCNECEYEWEKNK